MADRSLKVVIGASVTGLVQGMNTAKRATQDYAKSATKYYRENQDQLDQIGSSAFKVGAGLTAVAAFAVKSAMDWETAWTGVQKTVDGTPAQLSKVEDGLRGLAKETGFASSEVAAVGEAAGQLGISTGGVVAFTETMLALGVSTNLSAEEAATGLARFANVMGSSESEIGNMGSTIVALGNKFATTESEILAMATRLSGAGVQAGLTESDVLGISAAMSSVGIEAEAGGTAMSLTMKRIGREVETGGDKLGLFAETAGMSAGDFQTAWKTDAAGALTAFVSGLGETEAMGKSTNAVLTELGVTGIREADALLRLSSSSEGLADALGVASEGWAQNIALMDEADKFYNTTSQKGKQAWAEIKDAAIDAGDALLPVVAKLAEGVGSLASAFGDLPGWVKGGVTALAGVTGVSLLAIAGLVKLAGAIEATRNAFNTLETKGGKGGGIIAGVGRGAAKAGIALTASVGFYSALGKAAERNAEDVSNLGKELQALGKTGKVGPDLSDVFGEDLGGKSRKFSRDIRGIGEAIEEFKQYGDDGSLTAAGRRITGVLGSGFVGSLSGSEGIYKSVNAIKDMDAAFADLSRSKPDDAIKSFERLRDVALDQGASIDDVAAAFPAMTELLRGASEQMGGTADASEILNGSLTDLAPAAQASAEEMAAMQEAAQGIGESFFDMGDVLAGSLDGFGDALKTQTEALANFRQNAAEALRKGADETLVDYLVSKGPEGAAMLQQLADGSTAASDEISEAWRASREEIAAFVEYDTGVPKEIVTEFKAPGAKDAVDTAVELAGKYDELDAATVETILEALDYSTPQIEEVLDRMGVLDGSSANPSITAPGASNAAYQVGLVRAAIANLPSFKQIEIRTARSSVGGIIGGAAADAIKGGYTGMQIPPGYATGGRPFSGRVPGTPPADPRRDNVLALGMRSGEPLAVRSREWIINEKQSDANDEWLAAVNAGLNLSDVFGKLTQIRGFVDGGRLDRLNAERRVRDLNRDLRERERVGKKPSKGPDRRRTRYTLRGLDRTIAREELDEARAEVRDLRKPRSQRKEAIADRAEKAAEAKKQRSEDISGASESYSAYGDITSFTSPASVNRALGQAINDMATYTQLLIQLKKKGAAPWLLQQLQKAGPSRGSINLARKYLSDTAALKAVNAQAAQLTAVSDVYGQVTTDARWESNKSWTGGLSSSQTQTLQRNTTLQVQLDGNYLSREVARLVAHEMQQGMSGAVLPT